MAMVAQRKSDGMRRAKESRLLRALWVSYMPNEKDMRAYPESCSPRPSSIHSPASARPESLPLASISRNSKYEALDTNTEGIKILSVSSASCQLMIYAIQAERTRRKHRYQTLPLSTLLLGLSEVTNHITYNHPRCTPLLCRTDFSSEITSSPLY